MTCQKSDKVTLELHEAQKLFQEAETRIKNQEALAKGVYIPAINELRYAGRHIIDALSLTEADPTKSIDEIYKAQKHCKRAIYDASEACLLYSYAEYDRFIKSFHMIDLRLFVSEFDDIQRAADEIKEKIPSRASDQKKEDFYNELVKLNNNFEHHLKRLKSKRNDLNNYLHQQNNSIKFSKQGVIASIVIAVATVLICIGTYASPFLNAYANSVFQHGNAQLSVNQWIGQCIKSQEDLSTEQAINSCKSEIKKAITTKKNKISDNMILQQSKVDEP